MIFRIFHFLFFVYGVYSASVVLRSVNTFSEDRTRFFLFALLQTLLEMLLARLLAAGHGEPPNIGARNGEPSSIGAVRMGMSRPGPGLGPGPYGPKANLRGHGPTQLKNLVGPAGPLGISGRPKF
jgi:hypothetical protein